MGVEENLKTVEQRQAAANAKEWDRYLDLYAESTVLMAAGSPEPIKGKEGHRQWITGLSSAFPDMKGTIQNSFGQGDWVAVEEELVGTHTGTLVNPNGADIPATNKSIQLHVSSVFKFEGGKITEQHTYFDNLAFMAQLGLGP